MAFRKSSIFLLHTFFSPNFRMNNVNILKRCSRQSCSSFPPPLTRLYQEALPTCSFQENRLDYKRIQLSFTKRWNLCKVENISQLWIELSFWNSTLRHRPEHQTSLHDLFITFIAPFEPADHFRVFNRQLSLGNIESKWFIMVSPVFGFTFSRSTESQPKPTLILDLSNQRWQDIEEIFLRFVNK